MQKKIIALAVAGLVSGAAFAQSNVTVYGVADASFEGVSATGGTANGATAATNQPSRSRVQSNSSYIGFKGTEALGNGLNALFQIETQFALDNAANGSAGSAANTLANRDSFVGLKGGFGTVLLGYLSTPYRSIMASYDVMPGATGIASSNGLIGHINTGASISNGATANSLSNTATQTNNLNTIGRSQAIAYVSPTFGGVTAALAYTSNEGKATDVAAAQTNAYAYSGSVGYANGPFKATYGYTIAQDTATATALQTAAGGSQAKSHILGVAYTFAGATTVSMMYNQNTVNLDSLAGTGANQVKNNVWYLGAKHVMGAHEIAGMYAVANDGSVSTLSGTDTAQDRGANQFGLRYAYNLSKRTQAYAAYSRITNKANGNYDFAAGTAAAQSNTAAVAGVSAGSDPQAFGVGLRHSF